MRPPSRKAIPTIYLGYDSLLALCEGNPRTTIGLLGPMLKRFSKGQVPLHVQSDLVQEAIAKYVSLLSTIRLGDDSRFGASSSVVDLLDLIGEFFSEEINGKIFKAEPSLTLVIDTDTPARYLDALGQAMNQGALIMLSDEAGIFDFGAIRNARLRFSYLLCPRYHMPLIVGQEAKLNRILMDRPAGKKFNVLSTADLFGGI
jgi:hypothetical protein